MDPSLERRRSTLSERWSALTPLQRWLVVGAFVGIGVLAVSTGADRREAQRALLRAQFHLASDVAFTRFEAGSSKLRWPALEGTVQFSPAEFAAYVDGLDEPKPPVALRYRGLNRLTEASPDAFVWRQVAPPIHYGEDGLADWGLYEDPALRGVERGWHFCYAAIRAAEADAYRAVSCWALGAREEPAAVVQGVLDPSTRTLRIRL